MAEFYPMIWLTRIGDFKADDQDTLEENTKQNEEWSMLKVNLLMKKKMNGEAFDQEIDKD